MYLTASSSFSNFQGLDEETLLADYLPGFCKMRFMFICNSEFHLLDKLRELCLVTYSDSSVAMLPNSRGIEPVRRFAVRDLRYRRSIANRFLFMNGHIAIENSLRYSNAQTNLQSLQVGELSKTCRDRSI